jgi:hypothetical protein
MRLWLHRGIALVLISILAGASACSGSGTSASTVSPSSVSTAPPSSVADSQTPTTVGAAPRSPVTVTMVPKAELSGNVLTVSGTTSLIDGSVLSWKMGRDEGERPEYLSGETVVQDGRFSFEANVESIPGDNLYALLSLSFLPPTNQPEQVLEKYGELGQNLEEGDHVHRGGDYRSLEYLLSVTR